MPWSKQYLDWKTKATVKCQKTLTTRLNLVECVSVFRDLEAQVRFLVCAPEILVRVEWFFCQRTQSNLRFLKKKTQNNLPKDFLSRLKWWRSKGRLCTYVNQVQQKASNYHKWVVPLNHPCNGQCGWRLENPCGTGSEIGLCRVPAVPLAWHHLVASVQFKLCRLQATPPPTLPPYGRCSNSGLSS